MWIRWLQRSTTNGLCKVSMWPQQRLVEIILPQGKVCLWRESQMGFLSQLYYNAPNCDVIFIVRVHQKWGLTEQKNLKAV